jgi:hypothetical protein
MTSWQRAKLQQLKLAARKNSDLRTAVAALAQVAKHYTENYTRSVDVKKKVRAALDILAGEVVLNPQKKGK